MERAINELTFEEAVKRLDDAVKRLEKGEGTLSDSLKLFGEGVELASRCNALLDEAELKITKLIAGESGEMEELPFDAAGKEE